LSLLLYLMFPYHLIAQNPDYDVNNINKFKVPAFNENNVLLTTTAAWVTLPTSPHAQSRSCCAYLVRNDTAYLYHFGGGSGTFLRNVARFNFATNTWTNNVSVMPGDASAGGTVVFGDSVIYVFGGYSTTAGNIVGNCMRYDIAANTWALMATIPQGVTDALVCKYQDSLIYIVGGGDGLFGTTTMQRNTVQIYHVYTDTYTNGGTLPIPLSMMGGGIYGDTIMVFCGETTGGTYVANCYKGVINPTTYQVTFNQIANYPGTNVTRMASYPVQIDGQGAGIACALGAVAGGVYTGGTYLWNFCTDAWQTLPVNPQPRSNLRGCGAVDSNMYAVGGWLGSGVGTFHQLKFTQIDGNCAIVVGINYNNRVPNSYKLEQNYPNPFNPTTVINYSLPKAGLVKITVTDITGREVSTLVNGFNPAGNYSVEFDASNLSSGIYYYTLTAGDFKDTKKMVLIK
jgi:Secretion system C-terminal sorting domain/Kelch motif